MNIGMLWFDNDNDTTLAFRVNKAADYYEKKYGTRPNLCFVNPATGDTCIVEGVDVMHSAEIMPNHFWIGVNNPKPPEDDWKMRTRDAWRMEMDRESAG